MDLQPITETDEELAAIVADPATELAAILPALAHALDDQSFIPRELRPDTSTTFATQDGWDTAELEQVRTLAWLA